MRFLRSQYNHGYPFSRAGQEPFPDAGALCSDGSGNAEGVPFQLIFGQRTGEGIYFNVGVKISHLLGIAPEDFTECIYYGMIEEIIPLSGNIPADTALCRRKFINGEIKSYAAEVLIRLPDGTKKWILDTSVPLYNDETGRIIGSQGFLYDDNERKRILDMVLEQRRHSDETDRVDLDLILWKIYEQFRKPASSRGLTFKYTVIPGGASSEVFTDRYKVMQVLRNLVSNALKFTHEGRVEYGYSRRDGMIEFFVSDTGIGITGDQRPHIFDRFYQGDSSERRSYDGTGLGLSISKAYVELLGGEIWFDSRPGEGSVFRFTIPEERVG